MNTPAEIHDVIIIGGGAAGLMAAASASSRGLGVLLLEKNRKLGVKILMSGGTRCNITHNCSVREIAKAFGPGGRFLRSALAALPPDQVIEYLNEEGVEVKIEETGKIFPCSDRAIDVRDALVSAARKRGATLQNETCVQSCRVVEQGFEVCTDRGVKYCRRLLITSGGRSYPKCGTTGDGYAWAESFGHGLTPLGAALTPIVSQVPWANDLKGIAVSGVVTTVVDSQGRELASSNQPVLFTHFGFSGPGPMNVSRAISLHGGADLKFVLDFYPDLNVDRLFEQLRSRAKSKDAVSAIQLLPAAWPKRLKEAILELLSCSIDQRSAELPNKQLRQMASSLKRLEFPIHGTRGYGKAEVTTGGVNLAEVNSSTMESKKVSGLFFAGEILDLDGPIGGFNFQSAFSTGWLAGQNV